MGSRSGSFQKMEEKAVQIDVVSPLPIKPPANDNAPDSPLGFLRKAIDVPTIAEVKDLIHAEMQEYSVNKNIELKKEGITVRLKEEPRHYLFPEVLTAVYEEVPVALIGPAGSGKSTLCGQVAEALGLKYYLQNSVTGAHELSGYMDAHGKYNTTAFRDCFEKGGLMLIDEVDTSDAGSLKWLNTALANGHAMFPDKAEPVLKHKDFRCIIAANTFGTGADRMYVGANQLDASTLDRFVFFDFGYDEKLETILSGDLLWAKRVQRLRAAALKEKARIVISPRATIYGARLIKAGWKWPVVEERVIWKGIDKELRNRIEKAA